MVPEGTMNEYKLHLKSIKKVFMYIEYTKYKDEINSIPFKE